MKIAIIAPPFMAVPPKKYGGTELFLADLAIGLKRKGTDVVLYTNGESTAPVERHYFFKTEQWPLHGEVEANLKALTHASWAVKHASSQADLIHVNSAPTLSLSHFVELP